MRIRRRARTAVSAPAGQNLVNDPRAGFGHEDERSEVQRGVYLEATWRF